MKNLKSIILTIVVTSVSITTKGFAQDKPKPKLEKVFKRLDIDKSGEISIEELEGKKLQKKFKKIDINNDSQISLEEFKAFKKRQEEFKAKKTLKEENYSNNTIEEQIDTENTEYQEEQI